VLIALGSATVAATLFAPSARAAGSFQAAAIAEGVRYTVTVPGAPLSDQLADAGGPVAQASLDSLGTSRGFASLPYPGDTATGLPGLVAGFTGGQINLPAYPAYVASDHPTQPDGRQVAPGYSLQSHSDATATTALATTGEGTDPATRAARTEASTAVHAANDGSVTADSSSITEGIVMGSLHIQSVRSTATAHLSPDGHVMTDSSLDVTAASINDTPVSIGPSGLTLAGTNVPLPAGDTLSKALSAEGISVTYLAAQPQDGGVLAPVLQLTLADVRLPGAGQAKATYTLGGASVRLTGTPDTPASATARPQPPAASNGTGQAASRLPQNVGAPTEPPAATPVEVAAARPSFSVGPALTIGLSRFYAVLVGLGMVGAGAAQLLRIRGVRSTWS
jgi:hypothetical protein